MTYRKVLFALVSLLCCCVTASAQDMFLSQMHMDGFDGYPGEPHAEQQSVVSSLPSDVYGAKVAKIESFADEEAVVEQADWLILTGLGGALMAGLSAFGILYTRRRKTPSSRGVQIVGI